MKVRLMGVVAGLWVVAAMACGGGDDSGSTTSTAGNGAPEATAPPLDPAAQTATARAGSPATPYPTPPNNDLRRVTNAILGSGQEVAFWLRSISDSAACGAGCSGDAAARWRTVKTICDRKPWGSVNADTGYSPEFHDPVLGALDETCAQVAAALQQGSPGDSEEWKMRAIEYSAELDAALTALLEVGIREGFLN